MLSVSRGLLERVKTTSEKCLGRQFVLGMELVPEFQSLLAGPILIELNLILLGKITVPAGLDLFGT